MKYREIIREVILAISEGKVSPSLIAEIKAAEESLSKDLPKGLEGRVYARASEVLRNLRIELENSMKLMDLFIKAAYGAELESIERKPKADEVVKEVVEERAYGPLGSMAMSLVTFKTQVPKFVGVDMRVYGPFSEGDIALIPEENAQALKSSGAVEVMEDASSGED
ncbi:hypothetical protein D9Q81_01565 [Candidatus Korarchaeum cryptofilum]|uniref:Gins51 C-terminal domain-containing protein n=1 Tax=Candidatus Korarchaeum cryptofilum TaxID=498846 RepID=A0A429G899_9CREN|nr:hypothetical protein [Candidatus Korarchaeum cryptofilum]RSN70029.1 hypothetical protein D9Q81_01565 [Candidatus Korarchaeum cryptofilum]